MQVEYINRETKQREVEQIYGQWALNLLYGDSVSSKVVSFLVLPILAHTPFISRCYAWWQSQPWSAYQVAPFIKKFKINASEFAKTSFRSFNEFFMRKLKPEARPIAEGVDRVILPADGRYLVFPDLSKVKYFVVKGRKFDLGEFLQDDELVRKFADGAMVIVRLCPTDYHRFHFPVSGIPKSSHSICGALFSVHPFALRKKCSILWENKRAITKIETDSAGLMLFVEIGATFIGAIHQTYTPDKHVEKGDEKGCFSFGGSSVVLLFEKGKICFDEDLVKNSQDGIETKAYFGQSLGTVAADVKCNVDKT